jgi:GT2 family glycosyltransferase
LRFTPFALRLKLGRAMIERRAHARTWFARHGRPVTVVIPSFGAAAEVRRAVRSIRRTAPAGYVRIIVCDDAGPPGEVAKLRRIEGIRLIAGERNLGFAGNADRGLEHAEPGTDVVLLNADIKAEPGWLECLQYAAYAEGSDVGIVGARLLYPNRKIQHAGLHRNPAAPAWFDHYYRFAPLDHGPADIRHPVLAVTGACMYVKRELIERIGVLDPEYPMGFEDVDWCLRAWQAGHQVLYEPGAILEHAESAIRGREQGERELRSQRHFWARWGPFFERRDVSADRERLRIVYVSEGTTVGGGHRLVFEDINSLRRSGHEVSLFTLEPAPDWFDLDAPVRTFGDYEELVRALAPLDAIKVATWWKTAPYVWRASVVHGLPVYFVQDIETSYYPDSESARHEVLASYREEFRYLTTSEWNRDRLAALRREATLVPPAIDLDTFRPVSGERRGDVILAIARANPLKRFDLTVDAWRLLAEPRPQLCVFGVEPAVAPPGSHYMHAPTDREVNGLLNECTVFVQTSSHEGFALPPLEAMAAGAAVVCTDADGNRGYCRDGVNCLMPEPKPEPIAAAIRRLLGDADLRAALGAAGMRTAREYTRDRRAAALESFMQEVATGVRPPVAPRG